MGGPPGVPLPAGGRPPARWGALPGYPPAGGCPPRELPWGVPTWGIPQRGGCLPGYPPAGGAPSWVSPSQGGARLLGGGPAQGTPPGTDLARRGARPGYPPLPQQEQHSIYWLCGGRYASCVHAGGLSCC